MSRRGLLRGLEIGVENARTIAVNGLIAMRGRPGGTGRLHPPRPLLAGRLPGR